MGYKPFGFDALTNQNAASTQAATVAPTMPGYTGLDTQTFAQMHTPEDQIHWLYVHALNLANTKAEKAYVEAEFAKLREQFNEFKEHGFEDYYNGQIEAWIKNNAERIIKEMMLMGLTVGLTNDGYFCAYIPDTWKDITFDSGAVYGRSDYGCLILRYNVDGDGVIDNTYRYQIPGASPEILDKMIGDLELIGKTIWTNMDEPVLGGI